ncbi:AAA family ATPase [Flavobacterium nitrogenifigens]|uniref:AAA ATPase domain-containing protein n=1 Tax=Flavobacterium nitrogenifigens TaxID=1617283 RepID=A0A521DQF5_9FLAO|nr:AAA family ATPase [Flavobacterium nitrogenifigens]KAF2327432.1 AAA family ATPase [Flavobacterium nitrogenifigens]SMO73858.1 AAA ATPase domain-containing protein [Flavobacterium nitrogenifigens]
MLRKLSVENYKAFEKAEINLSPITILLGANSVGKSSIIQLLLLLQQTAKEDLKSYRSALKLYGGYVNLGDSKNLFRKQKTTSPLKFGFDIKSKELHDLLKNDLLFDYLNSISSIARYVPIKAFMDLRNKQIRTRKDYESFIDAFIKVLDKDTKAIEYVKEVKWLFSNKTTLNVNEVNIKNKPSLMAIYDCLEKLSSAIKDDIFSYEFTIKLEKNKLLLKELQVRHGLHLIISFNLRSEEIFKSDFFNFSNKENNEVLSFFDINNTIFNSFIIQKSKIEISTVSSMVLTIITSSLNRLKDEFSEQKINYVSPLRAHPKRYYMLDKAKVNLTLDTLDGDAIADVLKDNSILKRRVNNWLENFNLSVNVEEFKEVVHHLKVKQNELSLDITDVGFGISQVLPVIIQGFLSDNGSTTIIEQPEIHLHPKMQAEMADLFIDMIKNSKDKKLIIETHSEYLLKRLRRRIAEGMIDANDVSICLFTPQTPEEGAEITNLKIEKKGFFEWPVDFYGGELYDDTVVFLQNQN